MHRIAKMNLRYTSYALKVRKMLSEAAELKKVTRCNLQAAQLFNENIFTDINKKDDR